MSVAPKTGVVEIEMFPIIKMTNLCVFISMFFFSAGVSTPLESDFLYVCIVCLCDSCDANRRLLYYQFSSPHLQSSYWTTFFQAHIKKIKIYFHCRIMYAYVSNHFCHSLYCAHRRISQVPTNQNGKEVWKDKCEYAIIS